MVETIVLIAIPAIAFAVTSIVVIWNELKTQKSREAMFEECKKCPPYCGDENAKLRELVTRAYALARKMCDGMECHACAIYATKDGYRLCPLVDTLQNDIEELGIEVVNE